jgi:23S rRNA U2552 (ribose-2'-O)-methylase RlmE/FtsJ
MVLESDSPASDAEGPWIILCFEENAMNVLSMRSKTHEMRVTKTAHISTAMGEEPVRVFTSDMIPTPTSASNVDSIAQIKTPAVARMVVKSRVTIM